MASVTALRRGLKNRLATIDGLRAYATVPGQVMTPAAVVDVDGIRYDSTMARGADDFIFVVRLLVSTADDATGQDALDAYLAGSGAASMKAAIEGDTSLGGVAHFARVDSVRAYGQVEYGAITYVGAEVLVEVTASGT